MKLFVWSAYTCGYLSGLILPSQMLIVICYEIQIWELEVKRQREIDDILQILQEFNEKVKFGIFGVLKNYVFKLMGFIISR